MPIIDLTLANPTINGYFAGKNDKMPVGEFLYIHSHPMIQNFLSEIEILINQTALTIKMDPRKRGAADRIAGFTRRYAELLNEVNEESAKQILPILRDVFQLCMRIQKIPYSV